MSTLIVTNSQLKSKRLCDRLHQIAYVDGWRTVKEAPPLTFGTAFHKAMESYWKGEQMPSVSIQNPYENAKLKSMVLGYSVRWGADDPMRFQTLAVEQEFRFPLGPGVEIAGKIDLVIKDTATGEVIVGEHKTTSEKIGVGDPYWDRLGLDTQIIIYAWAASQLYGTKVNRTLYDVARKPNIRPKSKGGTESPDDFFLRACDTLAEDPRAFYRRADLARSDAEIERTMDEVYEQALAIERDIRIGYAPRNPDACFKYNRPCDFYGVCRGEQDLVEGPFRRLDAPHAELTINTDMVEEETE